MTTRSAAAAVGFALVLSTAATSVAQPPSEPVSRRVFFGGMHDQTYDTNGFHLVSTLSRVESSQQDGRGSFDSTDSREFATLFVSGEFPFEVTVSDGESWRTGTGVSVRHSETGRSIVGVADRDDDGRFDVLTYAVLDENGKMVLDLTDYEGDGQWDRRIHAAERYAEIWYLDRWYRVEARNGQQGIVIDEEFVALETAQEGRWVVP